MHKSIIRLVFYFAHQTWCLRPRDVLNFRFVDLFMNLNLSSSLSWLILLLLFYLLNDLSSVYLHFFEDVCFVGLCLNLDCLIYHFS